MKALNIIPASNQVLIHLTIEEFDKEFCAKKYKHKVTETKTQKIYFNDLEYIYCDKR